MRLKLTMLARKFRELTGADIFRTHQPSRIVTVVAGFGAILAVIWFLWLYVPPPAVTIKVESPDVADEPQSPPTYSVEKLRAQFRQIGYDMQELEANGYTVPRIWADAVPENMDTVRPIKERKDLFIKMVLPLILLANERIQRDRTHLLAIAAKKSKGKKIAKADQAWLENIAKSYALKDVDKNIDMTRLLKRVDVVPVSLALAQAAIESGWGASRFARKGNALFGQWTWGRQGIVPYDRDQGKTHKVKSFDAPLESVIAYVHNLNTNRAYRELRDLRTRLRKKGAEVTGLDLTAALKRYSEKGMEYVRLLRNIIKSNKMARFDAATLSGAKLVRG